MFRPLFRLISVAALAIVGDPTHMGRFVACLVLGAFATAATYWLYPAPLSIWPGVLIMLSAAAIGVVWEWRAEKTKEGTLR